MKLTSRLILLSTILFWFNLGAAQEIIIKPNGGITPLLPSEIKEHEKKGGFYNEFWNYHIALENGSEIYLNYSISHFGGLRDAVSGARLSLLNWNEKNYSAAREYNLEKLSFEEDKYRFLLHPERGIWFEGKLPNHHKVHFRTNKNGIDYDINLEFTDPIEGFTWGNGIFDLNKNDHVGLLTHIPYSKISGFIAIDFDTVKVTGSGYMDHTYQTNVGTRLFDKSFKYIYSNNESYGAGYFLIPKDNQSDVVGYAFEHTSKGTILKKPVSLTILKADKYLDEKIASTIKVCYESKECEILEIIEMNEKIAMLEELSGFKKMLAKRFLGGDIIELRGTALMDNKREVTFSLTKLD